MLVVVSYDVVDDKRRTKLAKELLNFGTRVQYSVFECDLTRRQISELKKRARKWIKPKEDSLRIYRLCEYCSQNIDSYGIKKGWEEKEVIVV